MFIALAVLHVSESIATFGAMICPVFSSLQTDNIKNMQALLEASGVAEEVATRGRLVSVLSSRSLRLTKGARPLLKHTREPPENQTSYSTLSRRYRVARFATPGKNRVLKLYWRWQKRYYQL